VANERVAGAHRHRRPRVPRPRPAAGAVLWMGVYPKPFTDLIGPVGGRAARARRPVEDPAAQLGSAMDNRTCCRRAGDLPPLATNADFWLADLCPRRGAPRRTYALSLAALVATARSAPSSWPGTRSSTPRRPVRGRPEANVLKIFAALATGLVLVYGQGLRARPRHLARRAVRPDAVRAARRHADDLGQTTCWSSTSGWNCSTRL